MRESGFFNVLMECGDKSNPRTILSGELKERRLRVFAFDYFGCNLMWDTRISNWVVLHVFRLVYAEHTDREVLQ